MRRSNPPPSPSLPAAADLVFFLIAFICSTSLQPLDFIHHIYSCDSLDDIPCGIDNHSGCMKAESSLIAFICAALTRRWPTCHQQPPLSWAMSAPSPLPCERASTTAFHNLQPPFSAPAASSLYNLNPSLQSTKLFLRQETHYVVIMTRHIYSAKSVIVFWFIIRQGIVKSMCYFQIYSLNIARIVNAVGREEPMIRLQENETSARSLKMPTFSGPVQPGAFSISRSGLVTVCTLEHIHRPCWSFWFKLGRDSDEWQLLQSLRNSSAKSDKKIGVSCSHGRNLEHLVDLDWFDSNFCIKSLAQILMYQVCANLSVQKSRNPFSRNVQISTYTGYKSLAGNVCLLLGQIWRGKEVGTAEW